MKNVAFSTTIMPGASQIIKARLNPEEQKLVEGSSSIIWLDGEISDAG